MYTDDMNQITGLGGDYERACRAGVEAASLWVVLHPGATPNIRGRYGNHESGYVEGEDDAGRSLIAAIDIAPFVMDDRRQVKLGDVLTPMQYHLILQHVNLIAELGWPEYQRRMRQGNFIDKPNGKPS